jgi:hypothetical protein
MASKDREAIKGSLQRKGFAMNKDSHHLMFAYISKDGKKTNIRTRISHGSKYKTINDALLAQMSRQCKLQKADFINLVDCPLTRDLYEEKVKDLM